MEARQLATVTLSHWVIDIFFVSQDFAGACVATTQISQHIAPRRPFELLFPRADAGNEQAEALAGGQAERMQEAGV